MSARRRITLRSWDAMQLPLPTARVVVKFGHPLDVPPHALYAWLATVVTTAATTLQSEAIARAAGMATAPAERLRSGAQRPT